MLVNKEIQQNYVADPMSASFAVLRPILHGILFSIKKDVVDFCGGYENVPLYMLPRLYRPGDGDVGICFEYAVHDAINRRDPYTIEKISDAVTNHCKVQGSNLQSILFGVEKEGRVSLINTSFGLLSDNSRVLTGDQAQPPKLKRYIDQLAAAFRRPSVREELPVSISGLWKADLFVGNKDTDRWVGATVKINSRHLEGARGLRLGIVPGNPGQSDHIFYDNKSNLVVCPMPYDQSFMEIFYNSWIILKQVIAFDLRVPPRDYLSQSHEIYIANKIAEKREMKVVDFIKFIEPLAQPGLLISTTEIASVQTVDGINTSESVAIVPISAIT